MAEDNEVGANVRWTGMEPAQFADWMVVGSTLWLLLIVDVWEGRSEEEVGVIVSLQVPVPYYTS